MPESNQLETSQALGNLSSSIFGGAKVYVRVNSSALPIALGNCLREVGRTFFAHEIDGASSEPASSHAAAAVARQAFGCVDHDVEFPATNLVDVAQGPTLQSISLLQYLDRARPRPARIFGINTDNVGRIGRTCR